MVVVAGEGCCVRPSGALAGRRSWLLDESGRCSGRTWRRRLGNRPVERATPCRCDARRGPAWPSLAVRRRRPRRPSPRSTSPCSLGARSRILSGAPARDGRPMCTRAPTTTPRATRTRRKVFEYSALRSAPAHLRPSPGRISPSPMACRSRPTTPAGACCCSTRPAAGSSASNPDRSPDACTRRCPTCPLCSASPRHPLLAGADRSGADARLRRLGPDGEPVRDRLPAGRHLAHPAGRGPGRDLAGRPAARRRPVRHRRA